MGTSAGERQTIVEGLAAWAVTLADMGATEDAARAQFLSQLGSLGEIDVGIIRDAATAVESLPQPIEESVEEAERAQPSRDIFGVNRAADQLAATAQGREWLERLAHDLEHGLLDRPEPEA